MEHTYTIFAFTPVTTNNQTFLVAEASSMGWAPGYMETHFIVRGHKGFRLVSYKLTHTEYADGNVVYWEYRSTQNPAIVRIFND